MDPRERLLTPGEVAALFRVDPKTVTRWAAAGRIHRIRRPGGDRGFLESEVRALLQQAIQVPVTVDGIRLLPGASIGVAHWHDQADIEEFLHEADTAMYAAKAVSRTHIGVGALITPGPLTGRRATKSG